MRQQIGTVRRRNSSRALGGAAAILLLAAGAAALAQDEQGSATEGMDMDAVMRAYAEKAAPGPHHEHLAKLAGDWTYTAAMYDPSGGEPVKTSGTMTSHWILGGRFLQSEVEGEFMGNEFHGFGVDGYDTIDDRYTSVWMDTMGTFMVTFEGTCRDDGRVRVMHAEFTDPVSGARMKTRGVTTLVDDDHYTYASWITLPDGTEFKQMELEATRQ